MAKINVSRLIADSKFNRFHWWFFVCCLLIVTVDGYDLVVYGTTIPVLMRTWAMGPSYAGLIGSCALVGAIFGALIFGPLADKAGRRKVIAICTALFSLAMATCGLCNRPVIFGVFRFLAGLGVGGALPNMAALATEWTPLNKRSVLVSAVYNGMQVGGIAAAVIGIWLLPAYGWRSVYFCGGISLFFVPLLVKLVPEAPALLISRNRMRELVAALQRVRPELSISGDAEFEAESKTVARLPLVHMFQEQRGFSTIMFWCICFSTLFSIYGLNIWLPKLMMEAGYPLGSSLRFLLTLNLGSIVGNMIAAAIADRFGARRTVTVMYLLGFLSVASLSLKTNSYVLTLLVALAGTCTMGVHNILLAYIATYYPPTVRSTGLGFAFGVGRAGSILGPTLGGLMLAAHLTLFQCFLGFAIPSLINFAGILLVRDKHSHAHMAGTPEVDSKNLAAACAH
jgi:AAHS family benzoate transporter-like MFS transporter